MQLSQVSSFKLVEQFVNCAGVPGILYKVSGAVDYWAGVTGMLF